MKINIDIAEFLSQAQALGANGARDLLLSVMAKKPMTGYCERLIAASERKSSATAKAAKARWGKPAAPPAPKKPRVVGGPREPDLIWDALAEVSGFTPETNTSRFAKAVKQLKAAKATPETVRNVWLLWDKYYPGLSHPSIDKFAGEFFGIIRARARAEAPAAIAWLESKTKKEAKPQSYVAPEERDQAAIAAVEREINGQ